MGIAMRIMPVLLLASGCASAQRHHIKAFGEPMAGLQTSWPELKPLKTETFEDRTRIKRIHSTCNLKEVDAGAETVGFVVTGADNRHFHEPGYTIQTGPGTSTCRKTYGDVVRCEHESPSRIYIPPKSRTKFYKIARFGILAKKNDEFVQIREIVVTVNSNHPAWNDETYRAICHGLKLGLAQDLDGEFSVPVPGEDDWIEKLRR